MKPSLMKECFISIRPGDFGIIVGTDTKDGFLLESVHLEKYAIIPKEVFSDAISLSKITELITSEIATTKNQGAESRR